VGVKERILHDLTRSDLVRGTYSALRAIPVLGLGFQKLVNAAMPIGTKLWIRIPGGPGKGLWMYSDPRFELGYANGDHEPWIQDLLKSELRPGDCYYDVGAHTGFFSLIAARLVGPSGKIVAIEPDPENAAFLRDNIARNGLKQVTVVEAAVWSSPGHVTFDRGPDRSNRMQGRINTTVDTELVRISVPTIRLDDFVFGQGQPAPQLMKMDVEGAEWDALGGAGRLLAEAKPKLLCEIHDPSQMGQVRTYLEQFGYVVEEWRPVHPHYPEYLQLYLWAIPKS
jgi:FkbM family methyltransferase